eukprot:CAMPEP_0185758740 /NCGR_PEP_ID=MMETSP1174-20130828/17421_1 /TAXON_ID=35687 /ORGANISM="Dictyocha speculum, Strain CCMP1381" /LENGTH=44 /DNA_ID= /DNA_START= /DNA_END= /DNA_ORIENTATION=
MTSQTGAWAHDANHEDRSCYSTQVLKCMGATSSGVTPFGYSFVF